MRQENYTARLNTKILSGAKSAIKRLSLHQGNTQHEILEQLILHAGQRLRQSFSDQEDDDYLALTTIPLRSNKTTSRN